MYESVCLVCKSVCLSTCLPACHLSVSTFLYCMPFSLPLPHRRAVLKFTTCGFKRSEDFSKTNSHSLKVLQSGFPPSPFLVPSLLLSPLLPLLLSPSPLLFPLVPAEKVIAYGALNRAACHGKTKPCKWTNKIFALSLGL